MQGHSCLIISGYFRDIIHQKQTQFYMILSQVKIYVLIKFKTLKLLKLQTTKIKYMDQLSLGQFATKYFDSLAEKGMILTREIEQGDVSKLNLCLKAVGLLRANWFGFRKNIISYNYGTVFAVSPNIIITCLHNIYSQKLQRICDQAIFIPNINFEYAKNEMKKYKVTKTEFIQYKLNSKKLSQFPLKDELVLMYLQGDVKLDFFLKIGLLPKKPQYKDTDCLTIIGYPSSNLKDTNMSSIYPKREIRKGKIHSIDSNIINYTINTEVGLSGSPVLCYNQMRQYVVVGIHTHRGMENGYNSGLFFSREVLQCLSDYEINIYKNVREEKQKQNKIMQIIIYFYLFIKSICYRQRYTILSPETYENMWRIENEYYNFVKEISVERDIEYQYLITKSTDSERYLIQMQRRSSVSDDVNKAYLYSCPYPQDSYENTSVISIYDGRQSPLSSQIQAGDYFKTNKSV